MGVPSLASHHVSGIRQHYIIVLVVLAKILPAFSFEPLSIVLATCYNMHLTPLEMMPSWVMPVIANVTAIWKSEYQVVDSDMHPYHAVISSTSASPNVLDFVS